MTDYELETLDIFTEEDTLSQDEDLDFLDSLPFCDQIIALNMPYGFDNE